MRRNDTGTGNEKQHQRTGSRASFLNSREFGAPSAQSRLILLPLGGLNILDASKSAAQRRKNVATAAGRGLWCCGGMSPFRGERVTSREPFVVLHSGLLQQRDQLLLKCSVSMMFNLIADVSRKLSRIGFAHTERRVSRLPREPTMQDTTLKNPAR